jgi:hypothetical protein
VRQLCPSSRQASAKILSGHLSTRISRSLSTNVAQIAITRVFRSSRSLAFFTPDRLRYSGAPQPSSCGAGGSSEERPCTAFGKYKLRLTSGTLYGTVPAVFYCTSLGTEPVRDWIKSRSADDRKIIGADIATVERGWPFECRSAGHLGMVSGKYAAIFGMESRGFCSAYMTAIWSS